MSSQDSTAVDVVSVGLAPTRMGGRKSEDIEVLTHCHHRPVVIMMSIIGKSSLDELACYRNGVIRLEMETTWNIIKDGLWHVRPRICRVRFAANV